MEIRYHRRVVKRLKKTPAGERQRFAERIELFAADRHHPLLNLHPLAGEYKGCYSINITGDLRAIFIEHPNDVLEFVAFGTHSELYEK